MSLIIEFINQPVVWGVAVIIIQRFTLKRVDAITRRLDHIDDRCDRRYYSCSSQQLRTPVDYRGAPINNK